ncbi:MAG: fadB [Pseudomonas sp.]|nr:fadB [Pseudomonas sp.]
MNADVKKAAVIGAGAMGSGIAAQFANAGVPVVLLDIASAGIDDRRALAKNGVELQLKVGGFMSVDAAKYVTVGNVDDDLEMVADADWIVEAIVEDVTLKQRLYERLEGVRKPGSIVSSNTSTIARSRLLEGMPQSFKQDFVITHFFNPPRHMQLLELVSGDGNSPHVVERVKEAGSVHLGKTVIACRDTAGFIANRLGCYWMAVAAIEGMDSGLSVVEADAVLARPFGVPRTGVFGLFDLVGIDLVPLVWGSLMRALPENDGLQQYDLPGDSIIGQMIERGLHGRKAKQGFYRVAANNAKDRSVLDLVSMEYEAVKEVPDSKFTGLRELCESATPAGKYAWTVLKRMVVYASTVAHEIAETLEEIDTAVVLGYSWKQGPFALADTVGVRWIVGRLIEEGEYIPPLLQAAAEQGGFYEKSSERVARTDGSKTQRKSHAGNLSLAEIVESSQPILKNSGVTLWDIGEGIACLELNTKMNVFDLRVFEMIGEIVSGKAAGVRGLVIGGRYARAFSAGADLGFILDTIIRQDFALLSSFISRGQEAFRALKFAPFPVIGAASGLALGGGCEVLLHCDSIVAHAELNAGLPEVSVGLVPAWGGCTQMLIRAAAVAESPKGPVAVSQNVFSTIQSAAVSSSALMAGAMGILRPQDRIVMSRDRVLFEARNRAISLADSGYQAPSEALLFLPGSTGLAAIQHGIRSERVAGRMTDADAAIADVLATVLTGGKYSDPLVPVTEGSLYQQELDALIELAGSVGTRARIEQFMSR